MTDQKLWQYCNDKKATEASLWNKKLVWLSNKDFKPIKNHFIREKNITHKGKSMRSSKYFLHIHAVEQGKYVLIHQDFGNPVKFFPLGILHLAADVIPFCVECLIKRKSWSQLLTCPLSSQK